MTTVAQSHVLYTNKLCPFAQRTELALRETPELAGFERIEVDVTKPRESWYLEQINPVGKVPALAIKGASSDDTTVVPESLVIATYVAEAFPSNGLLPADPVKRARIRYVIERASQLYQPAYPAVLAKRNTEGVETLWAALEELEKLFLSLSKTGPYIFGDKLTLADLAIAPFLARIIVTTDPKAGIVPAEVFSPSVPERINKELPRLKAFFDAIQTRPSWAATFNAEQVIQGTKAYFVK